MHLRFLKVSLFLIAAIGLNAAEPQISESGQAYHAYRDEPTARDGACNIRSCAVKKCSGECACFDGWCTVTNEHMCELADGDFFPGPGCPDVCGRLPAGDCKNEPVPFCGSAWEFATSIGHIVRIVLFATAVRLVMKEVYGRLESSAKTPR